jgi:hypothetical protein
VQGELTLLLDDKVFCRTCRRKTNHKIIEKDETSLTFIEKHSNTNETKLERIRLYHIAQCSGCDSVTFVQEYKYEKEQKGIWRSHYKIYPETFEDLDKLQLRKPMAENVPKNISYLLDEVIFTYSQKAYLLCSIGLRMIIEAVCNEKEVFGKNLYSKIEGLNSMGVITKQQKNVLHQIRKLGNATAHQITYHEEDLLRKAIDIVQVMLFNIYSLNKVNLYTK